MDKAIEQLVLTKQLGCKVRDADGLVIGKLVDLVVRIGTAKPVVVAIVVRNRRQEKTVPWGDVSHFKPGAVGVKNVLSVYVAEQTDLPLARHLLDAQIVDVCQRRLARVGEVELSLSGGRVSVEAVDVGIGAILNRLGLSGIARHRKPDLLDWADIHIASLSGHRIQLQADRTFKGRSNSQLAVMLAKAHPMRSAEILMQITPERAAAVLADLSPLMAASVLRPLEVDLQQAVLAKFSDKEAEELSELLQQRAPARHRVRSRFAKVLRVRRHAPS